MKLSREYRRKQELNMLRLVTQGNSICNSSKRNLLCITTHIKIQHCYYRLKIYTTILRPVFIYGSETRMLTTRKENMVQRWQRKILRMIYGPIMENGASEMLCEIRMIRVRQTGHIQRMTYFDLIPFTPV